MYRAIFSTPLSINVFGIITRTNNLLHFHQTLMFSISFQMPVLVPYCFCHILGIFPIFIESADNDSSPEEKNIFEKVGITMGACSASDFSNHNIMAHWATELTYV